MKQESVNTFNQGLNYDLNPLTTPNTVLTECINGALLTFNGDEFALQNDAGNTTIKYYVGSGVDRVEKEVSLSPGFYPLGVKEYGGILYIVSGCNINTIEEWLITNIYYPGNFCKVKIDAGWNYYRCIDIIDENLDPSTDSLHWELKDEADLSYIEFGSYPSPRELLPGADNLPVDFNISVEDSSLLYKSRVINEFNLSAGRYLQFTSSNTDLTNVSYYEHDGTQLIYHKRFYKLNLLQQLTNGYINLTQGVWEQFIKYKGMPFNSNSSAPLFWCDDVDFKFYCPNNFKGEPCINVEIEPLDSFKLNSLILNTVSGKYQFKFNVTLTHTTTMSVPSVLVTYSIDGEQKGSKAQNLTDNTAEIIIELSLTDYLQTDSILTYIITPNIEFNGVDITQELPSEYFVNNKYILSGSRKLVTDFNNIIFQKDTNYYTCVVGEDGILTGEATYKRLILKNKKGSFLDNQLEVSANRYYFQEYVSGQVLGSFCLGTYYITADGYARFNSFSTLELSEKDSIKELLNLQKVVASSEQCTPIELTIKTNKKLYSNSNGKVTVSCNSRESFINATSSGDDTFIFLVEKNKPIEVQVEYSTDIIMTSFPIPIITKTIKTTGHIMQGIVEKTEANIALINHFEVCVSGNGGEDSPFLYDAYVNTPLLLNPFFLDGSGVQGRYFKWKPTSHPTWNSGNYIFATSSDGTINGAEKFYTSTPHMYSEYTFQNKTFDFCFDDIGVNNVNVLDKEYINITNSDNYIMVGTGKVAEGFEIFPKQELGIPAIKLNNF